MYDGVTENIRKNIWEKIALYFSIYKQRLGEKKKAAFIPKSIFSMVLDSTGGHIEFHCVLHFCWNQERIFENWNLLGVHHNLALTPAAVAWDVRLWLS